jgi:hypothetical protein
LAAKLGAVYLPDADLSAGAATAKCREEKREEEQIARTSDMLAVFLQNARRDEMNATLETVNDG